MFYRNSLLQGFTTTVRGRLRPEILQSKHTKQNEVVDVDQKFRSIKKSGSKQVSNRGQNRTRQSLHQKHTLQYL